MPHHDHDRMTTYGERALASTSHDDQEIGLEDLQNWGPVIGGGALLIYGLSKKSLTGIFLAGIGAGLAYRGLSKNGFLDHSLKRMALHTKASDMVEIERSVTVERPIDEVYSYWRNLENLPRFMRHIETVEQFNDHRSHWVARMPGGLHVEWQAELIEDRKNELLVWRSVEGTDIYNEGFVTFNEAPNGQGTEIHARIIYRPPAGKVGARIAKFLKAIPAQFIKEDLRNFKQLIEAGEISTIEGQPSGRSRGNGRADRSLH